MECLTLDLSSFENVKEVVSHIDGNYEQLDALLHIAATMGLDNVTADGFIETVEINVVSPVLMNKLLLPKLQSAPHPRVIHVGSANAYDPLDWPATNQVTAAIEWMTGRQPHPGQSKYYWYSFTKFIFLQYAKELAERESAITSFSVNPGFFRDDPSKYKDQCKPVLLFEPCPQYPDQGATSTFFTAAQPGIEAYSGSLIDFDTTLPTTGEYPWIQSGDTCIPRPLPPPWNETQRSDFYDELQKLIL